ncbi:MAG: LPS-assembly protein LptD [Gallionellaceae bacterium]|nr:LPS-assembly protein LptD [Gallionellaceae bacterium]
MAPHRLLPLTVAMMVATGACQAADGDAPLRWSTELTLKSPDGQARQTPVFLDADRMKTLEDGSILAEGTVRARTLEESFEADWLRYDPASDEVHAKGNVMLRQGSRQLESAEVRLRMSDNLGEVRAARFLFQTAGGHTGRGQAERILMQGRDRYRLQATTYTTCPVGNDDWLLRTDKLELDYIDKVGRARDVKVEYLGVPILYAPWLDFPLDNERKSGFLTPTLGISDKRGLEVVVPWYWNIAPNRDATITPRLMTRRGLQVGGEFRYLDPNYSGELTVEALPHDNLSGEGRYRGRLEHQHRFGERLSAALLFDEVSDDAYFTDLSNLINQTSQAMLPRQASLSYDGDWWSLHGRVQNYQVLQDPDSPIPADKLPYDRLPQIVLNAERAQLMGGGLRLNLASEMVRFEHDAAAKAVGSRFHAYPSVTANFERTYGYLRPKFGWHYTRYDLDRNPGHTDDTSLSRSLPIFSLDGGAYLERDWQLGSRAFLQTLEPRLYYVRIPYKDQSAVPVFDASVADLFQTQLFAENQFIGVDRINDADQITLGLTSRLIEPASGLERLQVTLGQRYYFNDQRVTMPGYPARGSNVTDILAQVSGQVTERWRIDSGLQYNPDDAELARANIGAAYRDGPGRLFNVDLRYINERYGAGLNQLDLSWQWPIQARWYALGRINYSFYDDRLVEGLLGFEYNAGCWSLRGVAQKLATTTEDSSQAFFLQLELRGLAALGPNPLEVLKRSITGYSKSDEFDLP